VVELKLPCRGDDAIEWRLGLITVAATGDDSWRRIGAASDTVPTAAASLYVYRGTHNDGDVSDEKKLKIQRQNYRW